MIKYELKGEDILEDGHTMFKEDIVKRLNRLSYLENKIEQSKYEVKYD